MKHFVSALLSIGGLFLAGGANAAVDVYVYESGGNVITLVQGSINTAALGASGPTSNTAAVNSSYGTIILGGASGGYTQYNTTHSESPTFPGTNPPDYMGTGPGVTTLTTSGNPFTISFAYGNVGLPTGYSSGSSLNGSATFSGQTLSSLGFTSSGTYVMTVGGGTTDTITVHVGLDPSPTVTSVSPTSGGTAGGTSITITGTNFTGTTGVTVGGNACTGVTVVSATRITCTAPSGTAGTASIFVTTPIGTNAANTLFTYTAAPASIPSLSEWTQLLLALMVMTVIGWHFHRERSY